MSDLTRPAEPTDANQPTDATTNDAVPSSLPTQRHYRRRQHYVAAAIVGVAVGLLAVAFRVALHAAESARERLLAHFHLYSPTWGWVVLPIVAAILGIIVGLLTRAAPEAGGSGIPHLKGVLLGVRSMHPRRLIPIKFAGGVLGLGAGLSLGREGPTVQMGAALAQVVAGWLRVPAAAVPQLLSCGAGAGLAAAFNAPLAGFIFVIEELHRELSTRTFVGALIAAVVATAISEAIGGQVPSFNITEYAMLPLAALPLAVVIGLVGGAVGAAFNASLIRLQHIAVEQRRVPMWLLPGIVGAVVGLVAWWMPDAAGGGHEPAHRLLSGEHRYALGFLAAWLVLKFATTTVSYASGAPGGIFAPMLLLGAILGSLIGDLAGHVATLAPYGQAFAVLGMAAVFVGSVRAPLTGTILISEMTGNYHQLFAICVTCLTAHLVAEAMRASPIYDALMEIDLHRRGVAPTSTEARTIYLGVQRGAPVANRMIREAGLPVGALVVAIERGGRGIVPLGREVLMPGDHLTVAIPAQEPSVALEVARLCLPSD